MMPAAGHLEHMPSHTMQRVGRYEDAAEANRKGAAADQIYLSKTQPPDYYAMYVAHNFQFLGYATAMQGRKAETLFAMTQLKSVFPEDAMLSMPGTDWYGSERYLAMVRFGLWDEILSEPAPNPSLKALTGGYLYARIAALAQGGQIAEAKKAQGKLESVRTSLTPDATAGLNGASDILALAAALAAAQVQIAEHQDRDAIVTLTAAVAQEDKLSYDEPADWFIPVRHLLGAELIKVGQFARAESVYRQDLARNPHNGWSLFGLAQALRRQGKNSEADAADAQFAAAWKQADVVLTASVF
jgi:tetratricopeptide (TPR) repeat protein